MRWPTLLLLAALAGCNILTTTGGAGAGAGAGTTGSGGGDAGAACNTAGTCSDCLSCALGDPCATLYDACNQDADCTAIDQCLPTCGGDTTCESACYDNNPNGAAQYRAVNQCVYCMECPKQCPGKCT